MTLATLNTSFHIDLGRFVGDQTCINNIFKSNNHVHLNKFKESCMDLKGM